MTEKRERVADVVARVGDPMVAVARPGDLVLFVMDEATEPDAVESFHNALVAGNRPAGVEFLVVCGPRVVVVEGEGRA